MKTFKDVYIYAEAKPIADLISKVTDNLGDYWERLYENEKDLDDLGKVAFSFKRAGDCVLPDAGVTIYNKENNAWYIPNIVPLQQRKLNYDEYNGIITDFYDSYLKPAASTLGINIVITSGSLSGEDIVGVNGFRLLNSFSSSANKSTGSSHPCDEERWFAFIVETCHNEKQINLSDLARLLCELGWSDNAVSKLMIEYEFASDLIQYMKN